MSQQRKNLDSYSRALRDIERMGLAITIIESLGLSRRTAAAVNLLKGELRRNVFRLDREAEKLGAPYPG